MTQIPVSLLEDLRQIPHDRPVALLMRHSARHPILDPADPYVAMLTEEGVRMAEELGAFIGRSHACARLMSSPVTRCLDTAAAIARGAGWPVEAVSDERLSHPFFAPVWERLAQGEVNGVLPDQVLAVLDLALKETQEQAALDVLVTHDTIVGTVAACLLKAPITGEYWPAFLEGLFLWRDEGHIVARWRGQERRFDAAFRPIQAQIGSKTCA